MSIMKSHSASSSHCNANFADFNMFNNNNNKLDSKLINETNKLNIGNATKSNFEILSDKNYLDDNKKTVLAPENDIDGLIKNILSQKTSQAMSSFDNEETLNTEQGQLDPASDTQVIKVNEDDIIDHHLVIKDLFKTNLFDKFECRYDINQSQCTPKSTTLSKSLQRKLVNFYQSLEQFQNNQLTYQPSKDRELNIDTNKITINNVYKLLEMSRISSFSSHELISFIVNKSIQNQDFKKKLFTNMRVIVERVLIDSLMLLDQYHASIPQPDDFMSQNGNNQTMNYNPSSRLWSIIRKSGCQFLGPQMQDDVLRLILHGLTIAGRMARKILVLYVVQMLKKQYPRASKTGVGHVVQLLYKAGCFIVHKREGNASLMELKQQYSKYKDLRRLHDTQIIQISLMAGIRDTPDKWSNRLFGDNSHKSDMQSIIDTLQSQQTLENLIEHFYNKSSAKKTFEEEVLMQYYLQNCDEKLVEEHVAKTNELNKLNVIFQKVREDFEFFNSINFDKKNSAPQSTFSQLSNSPSSTSPFKDDYNGSSNESEEDIESNENYNEDDDDFDNISNSTDAKQSKKIPEQEQTRISWSLLIECQKRMLKILATHIEYSTSMASLMNMNGVNQKFENRNGFYAIKSHHHHQKFNQVNADDNNQHEFGHKKYNHLKNKNYMSKNNNYHYATNSKVPFEVKNSYNPKYNNHGFDMNGQYMFNVNSQPFVPVNNQNELYNSNYDHQGVAMFNGNELENNYSFFNSSNENIKNNFQLSDFPFQPDIGQNNKNFQNKSFYNMNNKLQQHNLPFNFHSTNSFGQ